MRKTNRLLVVGLITSLCFSMQIHGSLGVFAATDLDSKYQQSISEDSESKDTSMSVYGEFVYPEVATSKVPGQASDDSIRINLEWGSLKYKYTSGNYDNRTKEYKEGVWTAQKAGASDMIRVINNSDSSIRADITYIQSDADEGNFCNINGEFEDCKNGYSEFGSISLRDIFYGRNREVRFGLVGAPRSRVENNVSQEIGKIIVTVSKEELYPCCTPEPYYSCEPSERPSPCCTPEPYYSGETGEGPFTCCIPEPSPCCTP